MLLGIIWFFLRVSGNIYSFILSGKLRSAICTSDGRRKGKLSTAFQDFMVRYPLKRMKYRPEFTKEGARVRQKEEQDEK